MITADPITLRQALSRAEALADELAIDNVDVYGVRANCYGAIEISCLDATSTRGVIDLLDTITDVRIPDPSPLTGLAFWTGTWRNTRVEVVGYQLVEVAAPAQASTVEGGHCCKCRGEGVVDVEHDGYDDTATCWWCGGSGIEPTLTVRAGAA